MEKKKHLIFSSEAEILSYFSFDKCGIHPCEIKEHLGLSTQLPGCATVQEVVCRRYKPTRTLGKVEAWNTQY